MFEATVVRLTAKIPALGWNLDATFEDIFTQNGEALGKIYSEFWKQISAHHQDFADVVSRQEEL